MRAFLRALIEILALSLFAGAVLSATTIGAAVIVAWRVGAL